MTFNDIVLKQRQKNSVTKMIPIKSEIQEIYSDLSDVKDKLIDIQNKLTEYELMGTVSKVDDISRQISSLMWDMKELKSVYASHR